MSDVPTLRKDYNRFCPECGHPLAILDQKGISSTDKRRFTCTNTDCDKFMRFTHPRRTVRKIDIKPLVRHF